MYIRFVKSDQWVCVVSQNRSSKMTHFHRCNFFSFSFGSDHTLRSIGGFPQPRFTDNRDISTTTTTTTTITFTSTKEEKKNQKKVKNK